MAGILSTYLSETAKRKFAFGSLDCCTLMADWLIANGYPDAMPDRRGSYATRAEYEALMSTEGGIERSCSVRFAALGLHETEQPKSGDVCLVKVPGLGRKVEVTGAIYVSERLRAVVTSDIGLVLAGLPVVRVWSVECGTCLSLLVY